MKIIDRIMKTCLICMNEHEILIVRVHESTVFKGITVEYDAVYEYCDDYNEFNSTEEMISLNDIAVKTLIGKLLVCSLPMKSKPLEANMVLASSISLLFLDGAQRQFSLRGHQVQDFAHDTILRRSILILNGF